MTDLLNSVFCNKSDAKLILFCEDASKKCQQILKLRKEQPKIESCCFACRVI